MKTTKGKKWLLSLLVVMLACCLLTGAFFACNDNPTPQPSTEGAEKGAYAFDDITLTLNGTGLFTLSQGSEVSSGAYTSDESGAFTLTFANTEDGTATCTIDGDVLVFTRGMSEYRLYKQITFSVTFDNGESTSVANVRNGKFASKPTDPVKAGYKFVGWYSNSDFSGKPFSFDTEKITADITLYARWVEYDATTKEYTVSFDLGYENATAVAAQKTLNGKLYEQLPEPQRDGYAFKGWWVSAYNQSDKLTYQYKEGDAFTADTTLFALWQQDGATLATMEVTSSGASWTGVSGAATLVITNPDGTTVEQSIGASGSSAYAYDLSALAAGEYKYTLTYGENTVERYYLNKALTRVSGFNVVGNSVLLFDGVDNAEGYYITVKCGNAAHNHTSVYIGKSTNYNFVNCSMKEGGIEFEVKAVAQNYYESVANFKLERSLESVADVAYDETTGLLSWSSVADAQHYIVTIGKNEYYLGTENKLNIKNLPAGQLTVTIQAYTEGYNSAAATTVTINKADFAAPAQLSLAEGVLSWTQVEGATSYRIQIGSKNATAETNQFTIEGNYIPTESNYEIRVKAVFENGESLWSDSLAVSSTGVYAGLSGLAYSNGVLSWKTAFDAVTYEYKVNDGRTQKTANACASVELTQAGVNKLQVRFANAEGEYSEWAVLEVYAYEITFDSTGGTSAGKQYKAIGDAVELPTSERLGFVLDGWYNVAGGAQSNGAQFTAKTLDTPADLVLYANWTPHTYTITLDYNNYGSGEVESVTVTYYKSYTLPVPTLLDNEESAQKAFVGWYASADGSGAQYTDETGASVTYWNLTSDVTLYAKYADAFTFSPDGEGGYSVKASKSLGYYTKTIKIPATYKGLPVRSISEYGFKNYYYLENVILPDTMESIPTTAFDGCNRIKSYSIYSTGVKEPIFSAVNGSILQTLYSQTTLYLIPLAMTGTYRVPDGVTTIGSNTFKKAKFDTIIIPASVVGVEANAFVNCSALKTVMFEDGGTQKLTIDSQAFNETLYVEKMVLPARLGEIDNVQEFFSQFKRLSSLEVEGTFEGQVYATLTDKDGGKNLAGMLANAAKDTIIYCPISINANSNSSKFEIEIPSSIVEIADHAFDSFETASAAALKKFNPVTKVTFDEIVIVGDYAFNAATNLTEVVFKGIASPADVTIGDYAFYKCTQLTRVTFEEEGAWSDEGEFNATKSSGVKTIGDYAFSYTKLQTVKLPNSLATLGAHSFERCSDLISVDLSNVSPELAFGDYAFGNCSALTNMELTKNVGLIDFNLVFYNCTKLKLTPSEDNPNFSVDENNIIFSADGTTLLYFPDNFETYVVPEKVTKIGGAVFKDNTKLKSITIGKNVTEIGDSAFEQCEKLETVTIVSEGAKMTIGNKAFFNCISLKSIELPGRVVSIGDECFRYYGSTSDVPRTLTTVILNEGLETIGDRAFSTTEKLEGITIPASVTSIGAEAFWCSGIKTLTFAERNGATLTMGIRAFYSCTKLQTVVLPEGLVNIPQEAFFGDTSLTSVTIPTTVRNFVGEQTYAVGRLAFKNCKLLATVTFTRGGTEDLSFAAEAFSGCKALTSLSLPNRIASIDSAKYNLFELGGYGGSYSDGYSTINNNVYVFADTGVTGSDIISNLARIDVEEGCKYFSSYNGVLYNADKTLLVWCPFAMEGNVEIAKETKTIRPAAFYGCRNVTSITFQDGGTEEFQLGDATKTGFYGDTVFFGCFNLTTITFPARLTKIGDYALYNDTSIRTTVSGKTVYTSGTGITQVNFANDCNLKTIGASAFGQLALTDISLPDKVVNIGAKAFDKTSIASLTITSPELTAESFANVVASLPANAEITLKEGSKTLVYEANVYYSAGKKDLLYANKTFDATEFVVPASVTNISAYAFRNATTLQTITFEQNENNDPLTIGTYAFSGSGITAIELPARVGAMELNVFRDCKSLTTVTFEKGYKYSSIPDYTFYGCVALESISIPGEVTSIGRSAFSGCGVKGSASSPSTGLTTVTFELTSDGQLSKMMEIQSDAFNNCYALSSIRLAVSKNEQGVVQYKENTLPYSITILGQAGIYYNGPFTNCISLTEITLPDDLTYISKNMFSGCTSLKKVNLPSKLKEIKQNAFANTAIETLDLGSYENGSLTVYEGAFNGASKLATFDLSKVGTLYLYETFKSCTSLTSIAFPENIALYGKSDSTSTYYYKGFASSGLKEVTINTNVLNSMFSSVTSLTKVTLGAQVSKIESNGFEKCTALTNVDISAVSGLTIASYAFDGCSKLASFDFSKVMEVGTYAFRNCSALATIGSFNNALTTLPDNVFNGAGLTSIDLATSNVTTLGKNAFSNNKKLTTVTIPDTLESIGTSAFSGCTALTEVVYESSLAIPSSMFSGCTKLATVDLKNVASVGSKAFEKCTSLATIKIGNADIEFASSGDSFSGVSGVEFEVPENSGLFVDDAGALYSGTTLLLYIGTATEFTAKDGTTAIASNAFRNNTSIVTINLPETVKTINAYYTFAGCTKLASINLIKSGEAGQNTTSSNDLSQVVAWPNSDSAFNGTAITELKVFTAAEKLFKGMKQLQTISFVGEQIAIPTEAFKDCSVLATVKGDIVSVGDYAFSGCSKLASFDDYFANVTYIGAHAFEKAAFTTVTLNDAMISLSNYAFKGCTALQTVQLPAGLTTLGTDVFSGCTALTSINLDNVVEIGNYAFYGCKALASVNLQNVKTLGNYAFYNCSKLASVGSTANIESIGNSTFYGCTALTSIEFTGKLTYVGSSAFSGWKATQTITFTDFTEASDEWNSSWNRSCSANVVWKSESTTESSEEQE